MNNTKISFFGYTSILLFQYFTMLICHFQFISHSGDEDSDYSNEDPKDTALSQPTIPN